MAQSTILAAGMTAATSTDVILAAGATAAIGAFAAGALPKLLRLLVMMDTPDGDVQVGVLTDEDPVAMLTGPGTYRVLRPAQVSAVGVFSET